MREITNEKSNERRFAVLALAIFLCVFLGPFGTGNDLVLWDRVVFWTVLISGVAIFMEICITAAVKSDWLKQLPLLFQVLCGSAIGSIPGSAFVITINRVFRPEHLDGTFFPMLWLQVTVMGVLIGGLEILIWNGFRREKLEPAHADKLPETETDLAPLAPIRLLQRLPTRLREGQIISMSMQDHYVDVTTTLGNEMILMRLSDAIDLLDGIAGVQTHRSHWAARAHAKSLNKVARRHELILSDGRSIPVSSSYKAAVETMLNAKGQT